MKKFLLSVACLCLLAVLVPAAKLNAATLPWDDSTEVKGTVQIGSTMTVDAAKKIVYGQEEWGYDWEPGIAYYRLDAVAGQSYYIAGAEDISYYNDESLVTVYRSSDNKSSDIIGGRNLYAVANETWYIKLKNSKKTPLSFTLCAGQNFTGTVTKNTGMSDNCYYYKPVLSGEYTFEITSSDLETYLNVSVGYMKRGRFSSLSEKNVKSSSSFEKKSITASLQAGQQYVIAAYSGYAPYTLTLTQAPTVPVDKVVAKKAVSNKAKKAVVTWKKVKGASGYEITYSLKKNYKKAKTVKVSAKKAKVTLKKLKRGKTYYVKVRAFKTVEGNDYFGAYSKNMKVKVK